MSLARTYSGSYEVWLKNYFKGNSLDGAVIQNEGQAYCYKMLGVGNDSMLNGANRKAVAGVTNSVPMHEPKPIVPTKSKQSIFIR